MLRWLYLLSALVITPAGAETRASPWVLETFVDLTAADGSVVQAEFRRHACHGISETVARFCDEFKVPDHDCVRFKDIVRRTSQPCDCPDNENDCARKLGMASVRVVDTERNRTRRIKLAIHEGDAAIVDARVDSLCERLELDATVCGGVRQMLRNQSLQKELNIHRQTLLEHTSDVSTVERVMAAIGRAVNALLEVNEELREELEHKARAYVTLDGQSKKQQHVLERRIRELEAKKHGGSKQIALSVSTTLSGASAAPTTPWFAPGSFRIPRVHVSNFSYAQYLEYARSATPVIIDGLADLPGSPGLPRWTLQSLHAVCGDAEVTLKRPIATNASEDKMASMMMWAGIEPVTNAPLRYFLRDLTATGPTMRWPYGYADLYLHDASIRSFCPRLLSEFTFPRYFTDDRLQSLSHSNQRSYWPSLFIGGASTASALHVDYASTAAWMGLLAGRKHWAIAKPSAKAALYELFPTDGARSQGRFNTSLLHGAVNTLLRPGEVYEDVLEAGQVLFIPADCPHQVQNLETTIAVAANFVDDANLEAFRQQMLVAKDSSTGDQARAHARTLHQLMVNGPISSDARSDLSYAQFKAMRRP